MITHLSDSDFNQKISEKNCLVDFYAEWCPPCKMLAPVLEELASELKDINIFKINVDEARATASKFGVSSIPTMVFFKDGKEIKREMGFKPKEELLNEIKEVFG